MRPDIVYEDNNIIICNKRPGTPSQSDKSFSSDLLGMVKTYGRENNKFKDVYIINRLDRPVGGLVLFALNRQTAARLSAMTGEHSIEKNYYAVVKGNITSAGELSDYLVKDTKLNISRLASKEEEGARKALLAYEPIESCETMYGAYTLVKIRLYTGRHHQIRVQFSSHGMPLYGDVKYNPDFENKKGVYPSLFAYSLTFNNPYGADRIHVDVKPEGHQWDFEYFS